MKVPMSKPASERLLNTNKKEVTGELRGKLLVTSCAVILIIATFAITAFLTIKGLQSFIVNGINTLEFLTSKNWNPTNLNEPQDGALPFIFGSLAVMCIAAIVAASVGISVAISILAFAPDWGKRTIQPVIELLVGIRSVVDWCIGLTFCVSIT